MFAFVDETGNTGANLLDEKQPDFFTAALVTKTDFDLVYAGAVSQLARKFGGDPLHGKDLGFQRVEEIAPDLHRIFKKADARFFISRVEKRYLLATKIFDTFFDSGENAAAPWHIYNMRPLRLLLAFKVATIVTEGIATRFWNTLLEKNEARAKAALPEICQSLLDRVHLLPDKSSPKLVREVLEWARDHPETIHIHIDSRQARNGHMPNMVAFANLLDGLESFSKKWDRKVRRITHDRQSQFDATLKEWHEMFSTAPNDPIHMPGETLVFQKVVGSEFEVKADSESAGIQAIDVILWLHLQHSRKARFPASCAKLLNHVFKRAYINDFSFDGVYRAIEERFGDTLNTPLTPEQEKISRDYLAKAEEQRQISMKRYLEDGTVPYMRKAALESSSVEESRL